jgi:hypothetical protein
MSLFLNGFHFYADDMGRPVEASHFCMHLSDDFHQCVIFDTNRPDAKLIGIEYIVSERVFRSLPEDEKRFWHSHNYEVKSGLLVAPEMPAGEEHAFMRGLVTTYGKTWHTWQIDRDPAFPVGIPQLMMGFVMDGEIDPRLVQQRDERFHIASGERRRERADIPMTDPAAGANSWQSGRTTQLTVAEVRLR